jgi:toxin-antitoxin system PIN domain toxin
VFVVDTNILVHAADENSPFHERCRACLESWRKQPDAWFLTWGIVYEFLRVTTHPRVMRKPWTAGRAWSFVEAILASPGLAVLVPGERHPAVAAAVIEELPHLAGNLFHDAHTVVLMREHGVRRIYTRDADFFRFRFLDPVDPLDPALREPAAQAAGKRARRSRRA